MPIQREQSLSRARVPDVNGLIEASRGQSPAIGRKGDGIHIRQMPLECEEFLSGDGIPEPDGVIVGRRGQSLTVRREGDRIDPTRVPWSVTGLAIPHPAPRLPPVSSLHPPVEISAMARQVANMISNQFIPNLRECCHAYNTRIRHVIEAVR